MSNEYQMNYIDPCCEWDDDCNKFIYSNKMPSKTVGVKPQKLLTWIQMVAQPYGIHIENLTSSWRSGPAFCAIIHRFRNDLM